MATSKRLPFLASASQFRTPRSNTGAWADALHSCLGGDSSVLPWLSAPLSPPACAAPGHRPSVSWPSFSLTNFPPIPVLDLLDTIGYPQIVKYVQCTLGPELPAASCRPRGHQGLESAALTLFLFKVTLLHSLIKLPLSLRERDAAELFQLKAGGEGRAGKLHPIH